MSDAHPAQAAQQADPEAITPDQVRTLARSLQMAADHLDYEQTVKAIASGRELSLRLQQLDRLAWQLATDAEHLAGDL